MPIPLEVIKRVNAIGSKQKMLTKLTYVNRYGYEIKDTFNELDADSSEDNSDYASDSDDNDIDDFGVFFRDRTVEP